MANLKYSVSDDLEVFIYNLDNPDGDKVAMIYQPVTPEGRNWLSLDEATEWADSWILEYENSLPIEQPAE